MYKKVDTDMNFVAREKEIEKFWKDEDIFQKSVDTRSKGEMYMFYDGPPTANGKPHIGHVLTRVIKDMIPRYRTMKGYMPSWTKRRLILPTRVRRWKDISPKRYRRWISTPISATRQNCQKHSAHITEVGLTI